MTPASPLATARLFTLLLVGLAVEAQLTACKGGSTYLDTAPPEDSPVIDTGPAGCAAPDWYDRGSLGDEATGSYRDVAVSDAHVFVIDDSGTGYAVDRELLVGSEHGLSYVGNAEAEFPGTYDDVQVIGTQLVLSQRRGANGSMPSDIGGVVQAIDVSDLYDDADRKLHPEEIARLIYWSASGSTAHPHAQAADFDADVTGDGVHDLIIRTEGALLIFDGTTINGTIVDEGHAWGVLEVCSQALPVDTAVFGTGAAGQGALAVSCPKKNEADPAGSLYVYELPLVGPTADRPPPNDISNENNAASALTTSGGGNLVSLGLGGPLYVASPATGRVLELGAEGAVNDTLSQRGVYPPGTTEGVGRFGAAVALVRDGADCTSLVVGDPAYPLTEGTGYGAVYAVPIKHATARSADWSAWAAPYDEAMTDTKHGLGAALTVSPDGSFVAVGSEVGAQGWRSDLIVLSVE